MSQKKLKTIFYRQIVLLAIFVAIFITYDFFNPFPKIASRFIGSSLLLIIGWIIYKITYQKLSSYYEKKGRDHIPHFIVRLTQFTFFLICIVSIILHIFHESVFTFLAFGGLVSAAVMLGIGPLIMDVFSGIAHQAEGAFDIGDLLQVPSFPEAGKVTHISWRGIFLTTFTGNNIIIPHRKLADGFINYSRPTPDLMQTIEIKLSHQIPVDRVRRIISGAIDGLPVILNNKYSVFADKCTEGGIIYLVRFWQSDYEHCKETKHQVISAITKKLHEYNLHISETLGEYRISKPEPYTLEYNPLNVDEILSAVDLFSMLPHADFKHLCLSAKKHEYSLAQTIVKQGDKGDSLFVVAEGVIEVIVKVKNDGISVAHLSKGAYFGEMSLFTGEPRSASIVSRTNSIVFEISKNDLEPILTKNPSLIEKIATHIEDRNKHDQQEEKAALKKNQNKSSRISKIIQSIHKYFGI